METTKTTATLSGRKLKILRSTCRHPQTIELADGASVCIACEAVLAPKAAS